MTINERVVTALDHLDAPVAFHVYKGTADPYITFFTYLTKPEAFSDDAERIVAEYVQVDVWSYGDASDLVLQIHAALHEAGFRRQTTAELYEDDLQIYHTASRYVFERAPMELEEPEEPEEPE